MDECALVFVQIIRIMDQQSVDLLKPAKKKDDSCCACVVCEVHREKGKVGETNDGPPS